MYQQGQKLEVVDLKGIMKPELRVGEIVTVKGASLWGTIKLEEHDGGFYPWRFKPASEAPKSAFVPSIRKGARLVVVDADTSGKSLRLGEIVRASSDSYLMSSGSEAVHLEGHEAYKHFFVKRFKPAPPAEKKGFKQGQKLIVLDASKSNGILSEGETVTAAADAFEGLGGAEIVFVRSDKSGMGGTYNTARFAAAPTPAQPKYEGTLYYSDNGGAFFDLNEASEGEEIAVYQLVRVGKLKEGKPTIA